MREDCLLASCYFLLLCVAVVVSQAVARMARRRPVPLRTRIPGQLVGTPPHETTRVLPLLQIDWSKVEGKDEILAAMEQARQDGDSLRRESDALKRDLSTMQASLAAAAARLRDLGTAVQTRCCFQMHGTRCQTFCLRHGAL